MQDEFKPVDDIQLDQLLQEMLPAPVQKTFQSPATCRYTGGAPIDVVVEVIPDVVTVSEFVEAAKAGERTNRPYGSLAWSLLPAWTTRRLLGELIAAVVQNRQSRYRECIRCRKRLPPEALSDDMICKTCEAADEGLVY